MRIVKQPEIPSGLARIMFRMPIRVYRIGLGWLFGRRLLLLNHVGRVTGSPRQAVLEVVEYRPRDGSYVVASGWGGQAAWYRNVVAHADVHIQVGRQVTAATAMPVSPDDGAEIFARYAGRHRMLARYMLPRMLGMSVDGSMADFRAAGRRIPFVRFSPRR